MVGFSVRARRSGWIVSSAIAVEALYITELVGLLAIYRGYRLNIGSQQAAAEGAPADPSWAPGEDWIH